MGSLERRLTRLEHCRLPDPDTAELRRWIANLSDEELDARIEENRAQMGEAEYQELLAELKTTWRA